MDVSQDIMVQNVLTNVVVIVPEMVRFVTPRLESVHLVVKMTGICQRVNMVVPFLLHIATHVLSTPLAMDTKLQAVRNVAMGSISRLQRHFARNV
jgi:hypothetical protein